MVKRRPVHLGLLERWILKSAERWCAGKMFCIAVQCWFCVRRIPDASHSWMLAWPEAGLLRTFLRYLMTCSISVQSISLGQPPAVCRTPLFTRTTGFVFTCKCNSSDVVLPLL